jgi:hypothetical protein
VRVNIVKTRNGEESEQLNIVKRRNDWLAVQKVGAELEKHFVGGGDPGPPRTPPDPPDPRDLFL